MALTFTKTHDMASSIKHCSICYKEYKGWGNNALPVNSGLCCDYCNLNVVVIARWNMLIGDGLVTRSEKKEPENNAENSQKEET